MTEYESLSDYERSIINKLIEDTPNNVRYASHIYFKKTDVEELVETDKLIHAEKIIDFLLSNNFVKLRDYRPSYEFLDEGKDLLKAGSLETYYEKGKSPQEILIEKDEKRYAILIALYEFTKGDMSKWVDLRGLAEQKGLLDANFNSIYQWLKQKNFIKLYGAGYTVFISQYGIAEIEQRIQTPQKENCDTLEKRILFYLKTNLNGALNKKILSDLNVTESDLVDELEILSANGYIDTMTMAEGYGTMGLHSTINGRGKARLRQLDSPASNHPTIQQNIDNRQITTNVAGNMVGSAIGDSTSFQKNLSPKTEVVEETKKKGLIFGMSLKTIKEGIAYTLLATLFIYLITTLFANIGCNNRKDATNNTTNNQTYKKTK